MNTAPTTTLEQVYTVQQTAQALQVHSCTVRRMIERGELKAVKVGRNIRIPASALTTFGITEAVEA